MSAGVTHMPPQTGIEFEPGSCAGPLDPTEVSSVERMIGLRFSRSYLEFLSNCNGGSPKSRNFDVPNNTKVIERFLCITKNYRDDARHGPYNVGVVWSQVGDRLNDYLIPFAALFGGDLLCFDYEGRKEPRIVWWDHEKSDELDPHTESVANDFSDFLEMLYSKDEDIE
jgi:SMI1-KNR4 cell-wall